MLQGLNSFVRLFRSSIEEVKRVLLYHREAIAARARVRSEVLAPFRCPFLLLLVSRSQKQQVRWLSNAL